MAFDLKTATPVTQRDDGSFEPEEKFDLSTATPIVSGEFSEGNQKSVTVYPSNMTKTATNIGVDTLLNMPILGGFSPKQIENTYGEIQTIESKERSQSFKWAAMGMPKDLESIKKAETMSWADLAYEQPFIMDAVGKTLDILPTVLGGTISTNLIGKTIPEGLTKETIKNFAVEGADDIIEFYTDPAALLTAEIIGYGFKQIPSVLKNIEYNHPDFYKLLTTSIKQDKVALKQAYDILGLKPNSSATQINKAYRLKAIESIKARGEANGADPAITTAYDYIQKSRDNILKQITKMYKDSKIGSQRGSVGVPKPTPQEGGGITVYRGSVGRGEIDNILAGVSEYTTPETTAKGGMWSKTKEDVIKYAKGWSLAVGNTTHVPKGQGNFIIEGKELPDGRIIPIKAIDINTGEVVNLIPSAEGTGKPPKPPEETVATAGADESAKERGFVTSIKQEMPVLKVAGQYIPRSTDELAIKARNQIKDNLASAEKQAMTGLDDASIAIGAELLKFYSAEAEKATPAAKDAIYEKASELGVSMATRLTELGRSVQAASILSRLTPEGQVRFAAKTIQKYNEQVEKDSGLFGLKKKIPDLTPEQAKDIITRMQDIEKMPDGEQKAIMFRELQDDITNLVPTPLMNKIVTLWKAGLLTGIKTSGVNIFANESHSLSEILKDIPATLVDIATSKFTGKRSVMFTPEGILKGSKEGAEKGWRFLRTGYDERNVLSKYDYKRVNLGKSKLAKGLQTYEEVVFKILGAEDQPFYYGAKMRSLYEQARVQAINSKIKGKKVKPFVDNLVMNPTDEMVLLSVEDALIAVFQNETALGDVARKFQKIGPLAEFILPFGRTPSAVATQIINYSPVGIAKTIITNIGTGRFNQRSFSKGIGRGVTGTAVLGIGAYLYKNGRLNLDRPTTEAEQKLWEMEGRKPNTIQIGDKYVQLQVLGPLGNVILIGGHYAKAYQDTGSVTGAFAQGSFGAVKSFTEQTFLQSVNSFMDAVNDPKRSAKTFINSFASSFIPTIVKDTAVATDKKVRRADSMTDKIISRIPVLRQILEPAVDVLGREILRGENFAETMADPTRSSKMRNDPIVNELRRLKNEGNEIQTTQLGTKSGYASLSPKENTQLWKEAGQGAFDKIYELINDDNYEGIPDDVKAKRINKFINDAKDSARINMAIQKTNGMEGEKLKEQLTAMVEDGLLTRELYYKYLRLR